MTVYQLIQCSLLTAKSQGTRRSLRSLTLGVGGLFFCLILTSCSARTVPAAPASDVPSNDVSQTLAPGVVHRTIAAGDGTGVDIVDINLQAAHASMQIATANIARREGMIGGDAYTPREWLAKTNALAAANGGYFGRDDNHGRKEFIGLLAKNGRVRHAAPPIAGRGGPKTHAENYVRAACGITPGGLLQIIWAGTHPGQPQALFRYGSPDAKGRSMPWTVQSAVGCGPILVQNGAVHVTDRQERLASDGALPRTFVAYDRGNVHQIIGMASGMEYRTLAVFIVRYFAKYDRTEAQAAMCLDGGASTQLSYRNGSETLSPRDTGVSVPDAVVIVPHP